VKRYDRVRSTEQGQGWAGDLIKHALATVSSGDGESRAYGVRPSHFRALMHRGHIQPSLPKLRGDRTGSCNHQAAISCFPMVILSPGTLCAACTLHAGATCRNACAPSARLVGLTKYICSLQHGWNQHMIRCAFTNPPFLVYLVHIWFAIEYRTQQKYRCFHTQPRRARYEKLFSPLGL